MDFQWDEQKRRRNLEKHEVDFADATQVFENQFVLTYAPRAHELRWTAIGRLVPPGAVPNSWSGPLVAVVHTIRSGEVRIIGARRARANERKQYHTRLGEGSP